MYEDSVDFLLGFGNTLLLNLPYGSRFSVLFDLKEVGEMVRTVICQRVLSLTLSELRLRFYLTVLNLIGRVPVTGHLFFVFSNIVTVEIGISLS